MWRPNGDTDRSGIEHFHLVRQFDLREELRHLYGLVEFGQRPDFGFRSSGQVSGNHSGLIQHQILGAANTVPPEDVTSAKSRRGDDDDRGRADLRRSQSPVPATARPLLTRFERF